jgi:Tol biopolymer transport system component
VIVDGPFLVLFATFAKPTAGKKVCLPQGFGELSHMLVRRRNQVHLALSLIVFCLAAALTTLAGCASAVTPGAATPDVAQTPVPSLTLETSDVTQTPVLVPATSSDVVTPDATRVIAGPFPEAFDFRTLLPAAPPGLGRLANHLLFFSNRSGSYELYQIALDGSSPVQLTHNSAYDMEPVWSADGRIAFTSTHVNGSWEVFVLEPDSRLPIQLTDFGADCWSLAWSPDSGSLAFVSDATGDAEIYLASLDGSAPVNLTQRSDASDFLPVWSPNGHRIAFVSDRGGVESVVQELEQDIFTMAPDRSAVTRLTDTEGRDTSPNWSPDGRQIAFVTERDGNFEVYLMKADGSDPVRLTRTGGYEWSPTWSPDGGLIAFTSTRDHGETYDLYVMAPDGSNQTRLTFDPANDIIPRWWP